MQFLTIKRRALMLTLGLMAALPTWAADHGSKEEAVAMVKKAVAFLKTTGPEKSYEEFTHGKSFKDRDLYIVVYDLNGKNLAQGANPKLVGKDLINLKDPDGFPIIAKFIEQAKKGSGWVEGYKFMNPVTQKMEKKAMYLERVGETLVGCGIYLD
jgi:hypothetical protein